MTISHSTICRPQSVLASRVLVFLRPGSLSRVSWSKPVPRFRIRVHLCPSAVYRISRFILPSPARAKRGCQKATNRDKSRQKATNRATAPVFELRTSPSGSRSTLRLLEIRRRAASRVCPRQAGSNSVRADRPDSHRNAIGGESAERSRAAHSDCLNPVYGYCVTRITRTAMWWRALCLACASRP